MPGYSRNMHAGVRSSVAQSSSQPAGGQQGDSGASLETKAKKIAPRDGAAPSARVAIPPTMAQQPTHVLVTGSSGYVGHFLTNALVAVDAAPDGSTDGAGRFFVHGCTFRQGAAAVPTAEFPTRCAAVVMDGLDDGSVAQAVADCKPDVVVNLMAIASPEQCKKDPAAAEKLNVPTALLAAMRAHAPHALLVHLSTDMVYGANTEGPHWEDAECRPINVYGQTKLDAEQLIRREWPRHVIMRASAIYGPAPQGRACTKLANGSFLQFVLGVLQRQKPEIFFREEVRSFVDVQDVVASIVHFINKHTATPPSAAEGSRETSRGGNGAEAATPPPFGRTYNLGGCGAWTRLQFALTAATLLRRPTACLVAMTRKDCPHGWAHRVASPRNTAMDSSRLAQERGRACAGIEEGIRRYCAAEIAAAAQAAEGAAGAVSTDAP